MTDLCIGFDAAFEKTSVNIDKVLSTAPSVVRVYTSHLGKAKGKFIRTCSLLACAMNDENQIHEDAVSFASAIEILHLATLVHDDIIDNAKIRRGIETIQKKFGKRTAVICGDYLLAAALKQLMNVGDKYGKNYLPDYVEQICMGELRQHVNNGNLELTVYRYLSIINGKTAALFEASFYSGAILCEKEEKRLNLYRRLGRYVGLIFQLSDDCIDFEEKERTAGKNVQSDYEQGVITLPLIYALGKDESLKEKAKEGTLNRETLNQAVKKNGGLDFTRGIAKRYLNKGLAIIKELSLSEEKEAQLTAILEKAYYGLKGK